MFDALFQIDVYHGYIPQILLAEALFVSRLIRREKFWLRLFLGLPIYVFLAIVLPNLIAQYVTGLFSLTIFLLSLGLCFFLFDHKFSDILFCCVSAQFVQNISNHTENLIYLWTDQTLDDTGRLTLSIVNMLIVYAIAYALLAHRIKKEEEIKLASVYVFPLAIINVVFVYIIQYFFLYYEIDRLWVTHLPLIICCVFGLCFQYGMLAYSDEQEENRQLEYFLRQEHKQYEMTKNNIDLINMKAHDLKHHINHFRELSGYDEELKTIAEVVEQYETTISCGNKTLDILLTECQYNCNRFHIALSLMVQGEVLSFIHTPDLVSIFSNMLDNAVECERKIEKEEKRCIALTVTRKGGFVVCHAENYCDELPAFENGIPITTKPDKDFHGFGIKSVRYVVQKYGGTMKAGADGNLFVVNILIPVPYETEKSS